MTLTSSVKRWLLSVVALGSVVACQGGELTSSEPHIPPAPASLTRGQLGAPPGKGFAGTINNNFHAARCADRRTSSDAALFGPAGGTLVFGNSRLIIPGGALTDTVTISATIVDETTSRVELRPHGLQFAKPAGLLLSVEGCVFSPDQVPTLVYLSEDGTVLETIEAVFDPRWKTFAAPIYHFSGYAIAF